MPTDPVWSAIFEVSPTILFGLLFWFVFRALFRSDRTERAALAKVEAEERARMGLPPREAVAAPVASAASSSSSAPTGSATSDH